MDAMITIMPLAASQVENVYQFPLPAANVPLPASFSTQDVSAADQAFKAYQDESAPPPPAPGLLPTFLVVSSALAAVRGVMLDGGPASRHDEEEDELDEANDNDRRQDGKREE